MSDEVDWGPHRPPVVAWAGGLLLVLALGQLAALVAAAVLASESVLRNDPARIVAASVAGLLALQLLAAVGVLRLWRGFRAGGILLALAGLAMHGIGLGPPGDPPVVLALNAGLATAYVIVIVLLVRGREAFR